MLVPTFVTQRRNDELKTIHLTPGDVIIASYQKSGTTWVQHIVKLLRSNGVDDGVAVPREIPWLEFTETQPGRPYYHPVETLKKPIYMKSHMPYKLVLGVPPHTTKAKYIYIARNPKDVAVSYFHHTRAFIAFHFSGSWDEFFNLYVAGHVCFGLWFDHVLGWWEHRSAENILFLKYEDLIHDPHKEVQNISSFLFGEVSLDVVEKVVRQSTFESMKGNPAANFSWSKEKRHPEEPPFMRKGKIGDWKNYFTSEQNATFDALYSEKMKDSGLHFEFS